MSNFSAQNSIRNIFPYLVQAALIFSLIVSGLFIETYDRGLIFQNNSLNFNLIKLVLTRSLITTIAFVVIYQISRSWLSVLYNYISKKLGNSTEDEEEHPKIYFFSDVFVILSFILLFMPVRPILQETFKESNISDFHYAFVRYDGILSVIILLILAIPLSFFVNKYIRGRTKLFHLITIAATIVAVGIINNAPNFDARALETRASWVKQNWNQQGIDAQKTLQNSETDKEKAIAFYWMGVSENRKGNYYKAIEYQLEATRLDTQYGAAYASLANGYISTGQNEKSLENSKKCIQYDPSYAWCYQALSNYYWVTGDVENAIIYSKKATDLDPKNKELKDQYEYFFNHGNN